MSTSAPAATRVHRVEIHPKPHAGDPRAADLIAKASLLGVTIDRASSAAIYLIEADLTDDQLDTIVSKLLCNSVVEDSVIGVRDPGATLVEVHPLPGVMDPPAQSVRSAIKELTGVDAQVSTAHRYEISGLSKDKALDLARRVLSNAIVSAVHDTPQHPESLPKGHAHPFNLTHVPIRDLDDAGLEKLSREGHLFLDLHEMKAIQDEYKRLDREPTDIELETLAQTWSEHCVHKTLKSTIRYTSDDPDNDPVYRADRPGHEHNPDGSVTIHNLLKSTVAAATFELIEEGLDWTLSVFVDNAGIIRFDDDHAVCIKVETHNHPSALEPYGGAATGIGGCIRDIIGTGLAAKPIASTDVFCVAHPDTTTIPEGCLHPATILTEVVAGVRDYGNRMGIPTLNGAVWFDQRYIGNPLVYCGCIGIMPTDLIAGDAKPGDRIIALGGRTGRDGIHGATFSSAELTDAHADEFSHAVQIGNAIEEKRTLDAILRARDTESGPLFSAITDCGAGGFSSAIGEMGEKIGAHVHLDRAPLKYDGLTYDEIWISEAQERMVLSVPSANLDALRAICDEEHVELADLGTFGTDNAQLILDYHEHEVARLPMAFIHDGIPTPTRDAHWSTPKPHATNASIDTPIPDALLTLLAHPNIASKHWIIRQYDHEVQGNTVVKPLVGPSRRGPSDASIIEPVPGTNRGLAIACGLATGLEADPYQMALAAIDECVRNLVCAGADPTRIAILDNFCWPSCKKPQNLASLVRAAEGCYDAAKAFKTPFVSGKDSLNNQFTTKDGRTIEIPPTLLITGMGIVPTLDHAVTSDAKAAGATIALVGTHQPNLGASHAQRLGLVEHTDETPTVDLTTAPALMHALHNAIQSGLVDSAHDISDGGALVTLAEMLIAGSTPDRPIGFTGTAPLDHALAFAEPPTCVLVETRDPAALTSALGADYVRALGTLDDTGTLSWDSVSVGVEDLARAWRSTLDW
jgi:phosphoribosylformylglycinamidine synthase